MIIFIFIYTLPLGFTLKAVLILIFTYLIVPKLELALIYTCTLIYNYTVAQTHNLTHTHTQGRTHTYTRSYCHTLTHSVIQTYTHTYSYSHFCLCKQIHSATWTLTNYKIHFLTASYIPWTLVLTHTRTSLYVTSPRADLNFLTHFTGKGEPLVFKWSALIMRSANWNVWGFDQSGLSFVVKMIREIMSMPRADSGYPIIL